MEFLTAYVLVSLIPQLNGLGTFLSFLGLGGLLVHGYCYTLFSQDGYKIPLWGSWAKGVTTASVVGVVLSTVMPSREDVVYIIGVGYGIKAVNSELVQEKMPDWVEKIISDYLEEPVNE